MLDQPIQLTLRLRSALLGKWIDDLDALAEALNDENSALRHTEAWLVTHIVQNVPIPSDMEDVSFLQMGEQTRWAEPRFSQKAADEGSVIEGLELVFNEKEWPFVRPEENILRFPAGIGEGRSWVAVALADEKARTCTLFSIHMKPVKKSMRLQATLWIAKTNYEQAEGCFDMDPDDGEVRYRTTFSAATRAQITEGVRENFTAMAEHFDVIKKWSE